MRLAMSWWIDLEYDDHKPCLVAPFSAGGVLSATHIDGNLVLVPSEDPSVNVTYNYSKFYYDEIDQEQGIRWLDGKLAQDTIERLELAVLHLGTSQSSNYWDANEGNAGYILNVLLSWAKAHPEARWSVS
jgi:hypothetical protein